MKNKFRINLYINNYCNYDCPYCIANIPVLSATNRHYSMDYNLLRLMVNHVNKYLFDYDIIYVIMGGETTLHPHFNKIIEILSNTQNLYKIKFLTNSSIDFSKIITFSYPCVADISVHYQQMLKHGFDKSLSIMLNNIKYVICTLHGRCSLTLLVDDNFPIEKQNFIISEYISLMQKINSVPDYCKRVIVSTGNYINKNFSFKSIVNVFNKYGSKNVYPYRIISVDIHFQYDYNCEIIRQNKLIDNILLKRAWFDIIKKCDNSLLCNNSKCTCAICLEVE